MLRNKSKYNNLILIYFLKQGSFYSDLNMLERPQDPGNPALTSQSWSMIYSSPAVIYHGLPRGWHKHRAANLQNMFSILCWKNFHIFNYFSVSLNLFLIRLKTVIMATSYLLWWDPLAPSGNSSGFSRYYQNRKWGRACVTTTCGREKNECFGD